MTDFTITPRFANKAGTIPMPDARNVLTREGHYVGHIVLHDGTWTPLMSTEDLENATTVEMLTRAARQMNDTGDGQ